MCAEVVWSRRAYGWQKRFMIWEWNQWSGCEVEGDQTEFGWSERGWTLEQARVHDRPVWRRFANEA